MLLATNLGAQDHEPCVGDSLNGKNIKLQWRLDAHRNVVEEGGTLTWLTAQVVSYDEKTNMQTVKYHLDGDEETLVLDKAARDWELLPTSAPLDNKKLNE